MIGNYTIGFMESKKIEAYKKICELAEVPSILIEYPELIFPMTARDEDIKWTKELIKEKET